MSDLPKCLLCGCEAVQCVMAEGCIAGCGNVGACSISGTQFTLDEWQRLMGRGEPVLYQSRCRPLWREDAAWSNWENCSQGHHNDLVRVPVLHEWAYETRALYTQAPAVDAEQYKIKWINLGLPDMPHALNDGAFKLFGSRESVEHFKDEFSKRPAVDDAVLRDAELYRWFKNNAANAWFGDELISLVEAGGDRLDAAIIKAIKGEG